MTNGRISMTVTAICLSLLLGMSVVKAQETAPAVPETTESSAVAAPPLRDNQEQIRLRFARFEETLYKMARYLQKTEPARAELVLRALSRSKEERVAERMKLISQMLSKEGGSPRYADAIEEQDQILSQLRELLTILRSEDILDENQKEQERLKELARQVSALIDAEKVHQADTQRGEPTDRVSQAQQRTAERTDSVIKKVDEHDRAAQKDVDDERSSKPGESENSEGDQKSGDQKSGDQKSGDQKSGDQKSGDQKSGDQESGEQESGEQESGERESGERESGDRESGEQKEDSESQSGEPQSQQNGSQQGEQSPEGEQSSAQQNESQEQSGPPRATPGREELEAAREKMERAIEELKKQNRDGASKTQEEAIQKLMEAKEKIEELLRQLREEERELLLRALEARFQKMLQLQQVVLETTQAVGGVPKDRWEAGEFARCRDAASAEREILIEADKALEVLRADGSSVAFPEAVEQIRTDVAEIASRLGREDAGELTIAIEREVIDALEEMILSLQKEMEKIREQKDGQPGQQGSPDEPGLVDQLAELKMLKTLQLRINRRTKTLGQMFTGEQATDPDVIAQLRELSDRQGRLQQATYDLASGRTSN